MTLLGHTTHNTLDALGRVSYMALLEGHPSYDGIRVYKALMPSYKVWYW